MASRSWAMPAWKIWMPRVVGLLTLAMVGLGLALALGTRRRGAAAALAAANAPRIEALMTELVALERAGDDPNRRAKVMAELERLWPDKGADKGPTKAPTTSATGS